MDNNFKTQGGLIITSIGAGTNADKLLVRDSSGLIKTVDNDFYGQSEIQNFFSGTTNITGYNNTNWDTAYSWGDHAGLYASAGHTHPEYENNLTFNSTGAATVSRAGDIITIGATNTTYANMSLSELNTGTSTTARSISASTLKSWGDGRYLTSMPTHNHDADYLPIDGQDNEVTVINIAEGDLPADYTKADVIAHLNTIGVSKDDIETIVVNIDDSNTLTIDWANVGGKPTTFPPSSHTHSEYSLTGHTHSGVYEPVFSKNTAFNKNFGTTTGTVAEGNDSRITNGQTAFGWGNHANTYLPLTGGTITGALTFTPTGAGTPVSSSFGLDNTQKSYINFSMASGSNDPGYIMHETSGVAASSNKGVLHLAPSDDNARGDYVTIHGTNDPEVLKMHTDGYIEALGGNSANWNSAYSWGNHASAGYLTSYSETDTLDSVTTRGNTTTNDITVGYTNMNGGANFLNGATNFRIYNNAGNNELFVRDTTNAAMLMTYGVGYVTSNVAFFASSGATITGTANTDAINASGDITISKTSPVLKLSDTDGITGTYPKIEFETTNNQGVAIEHNELDGELPAGGYGLIIRESSGNTQFPTTGELSLSVLGEMYAGGTTVGALKKVWHAGNLTNLNQLATRNFSDLQNKPTTVSGYGITDAVTSADLNNYLPLSGGTMTGDISISKNTPTLSFVDTATSSPDNQSVNLRFEGLDVNLPGTEGGALILEDVNMGMDPAFISNGNIYMNGSGLVATQSWVNTQGYLSGVPTFQQVLDAGSNEVTTAIKVPYVQAGNGDGLELYGDDNDGTGRGANMTLGGNASPYANITIGDTTTPSGQFKVTNRSTTSLGTTLFDHMSSVRFNVDGIDNVFHEFTNTHYKFLNSDALESGVEIGLGDILLRGGSGGNDMFRIAQTGGNSDSLLDSSNTVILSASAANYRFGADSVLTIDSERVPVSKGTGTNEVSGLWQGTQAEYDAIGTKDANTIYFIK